jgi:hypothetical protein
MTKKYVYNNNLLFPNGGSTWAKEDELPFSIKVEPLTLACINVKDVGNGNFMGSPTWHFQVEGHGDQWYHTHYAWSIVEDTEENVRLALKVREIHRQRDQLALQADRILKRIKNISNGEEG